MKNQWDYHKKASITFNDGNIIFFLSQCFDPKMNHRKNTNLANSEPQREKYKIQIK